MTFQETSPENRDLSGNILWKNFREHLWEFLGGPLGCFFLVPNIPGKSGDISFFRDWFFRDMFFRYCTCFSVTGVKKTQNPKSKSKNKKLQCFGHKRFFLKKLPPHPKTLQQNKARAPLRGPSPRGKAGLAPCRQCTCSSFSVGFSDIGFSETGFSDIVFQRQVFQIQVFQ